MLTIFNTHIATNTIAAIDAPPVIKQPTPSADALFAFFVLQPVLAAALPFTFAKVDFSWAVHLDLNINKNHFNLYPEYKQLNYEPI